MKKIVLGLVLLGLMIATVGCGVRAPAPAAPAAPVMSEQAAPSAAPAESETSGGAAQGPAGDAERMIIRTVDLSVVVTDAAEAQQAVANTVNALGGYIADSSAWREGEQLRARMTVRAPAEKLDALLAAIKGSAVRVQEENVKGQDVTEEFTDLSAQLTNLEATEKELRELLTEVREKTQKAEDVLAVHRELTAIRGQIEQLKGRMQYLSTMTAMATANVEADPRCSRQAGGGAGLAASGDAEERQPRFGEHAQGAGGCADLDRDRRGARVDPDRDPDRGDRVAAPLAQAEIKAAQGTGGVRMQKGRCPSGYRPFCRLGSALTTCAF